MEKSPLAKLISELKNIVIKETSIPVYFTLPDENVLEPFIVIGQHNDSDDVTPKVGKEVQNITLQIDLFYPMNSRIKLENDMYHLKWAIHRSSDRIISIGNQVLVDNSIGRDTYHVVMSVAALI